MSVLDLASSSALTFRFRFQVCAANYLALLKQERFDMGRNNAQSITCPVSRRQVFDRLYRISPLARVKLRGWRKVEQAICLRNRGLHHTPAAKLRARQPLKLRCT
jgi:hypothetical protein